MHRADAVVVRGQAHPGERHLAERPDEARSLEVRAHVELRDRLRRGVGAVAAFGDEGRPGGHAGRADVLVDEAVAGVERVAGRRAGDVGRGSAAGREAASQVFIARIQLKPPVPFSPHCGSFISILDVMTTFWTVWLASDAGATTSSRRMRNPRAVSPACSVSGSQVLVLPHAAPIAQVVGLHKVSSPSSQVGIGVSPGLAQQAVPALPQETAGPASGSAASIAEASIAWASRPPSRGAIAPASVPLTGRPAPEPPSRVACEPVGASAPPASAGASSDLISPHPSTGSAHTSRPVVQESELEVMPLSLITAQKAAPGADPHPNA